VQRVPIVHPQHFLLSSFLPSFLPSLVAFPPVHMSTYLVLVAVPSFLPFALPPCLSSPSVLPSFPRAFHSPHLPSPSFLPSSLPLFLPTPKNYTLTQSGKMGDTRHFGILYTLQCCDCESPLEWKENRRKKKKGGGGGVNPATKGV
jgi:hypothetical protein